MAKKTSKPARYSVRLGQLATEAESIMSGMSELEEYEGRFFHSSDVARNMWATLRQRFVAWQTSSVSILEKIVPHLSRNRRTLARFPSLELNSKDLNWAAGIQKGFSSDCASGILPDSEELLHPDAASSTPLGIGQGRGKRGRRAKGKGGKNPSRP